MKKVSYILVVMLFLVILGYAWAETESVVNTKNEFGGKTKEFVLSPNEDGYKKGIAKRIVYYDANGKRVKAERYYTDDFALKNGVAKGILTFDNEGRPLKTEFYDRNGKLVPVK